ncbi:MAG: calcium/sodium antiporter [bacterium]|nr:calcium/sodium antiporter [bacterium]
MLLYITLLIVGFVLLIKGADFLVNGASSLAKRFNVSDIAIGLTIVAMGTSAPELVVNLISGSAASNHDIVFGNIIGSNIFNLFLILGVAGVIYPITVQKNSLWKEVPYSLIATFIFFVLLNDSTFQGSETNAATFWDGLILLGMFCLFLLYIFMNMRRGGEIEELEDIQIYGTLKTTLMIAGGMAGLAFGGNLIVENAVSIAEDYGVDKKLIGLTILAAGTSLPELATTAVAAFHKKSDLAVGNIVGSNIFNILLVLGSTAVIHGPLEYSPIMNIDLYIVMIGTFMLFIFMFTFNKYKLDRSEGALYLIGFVAYMTYLLMREGYITALW